MWKRLIGWRLSRDTILLIAGLVFFTHEVFLSNADRPSVITGAVGLMCSPFVLRFDERRRQNGNGGNGRSRSQEDDA